MNSNIVKCQSCGANYNIKIHHWCPSCRVVYNGPESFNNKHHIVGVVNDTWEVKIDTINSCSKAPESIEITIDPIAKSKIDYLMSKFERTEWLAYLIGDGKNKYNVIDIFIPNQEVNSVNVDNVKCDEFNSLNVIGVIHSHHNMGNSFSHTDDEWINQNHDISLCISKSGINGHARWKTPCGSYKIVKVKVKLNISFNFDKDEFDKEIKEKIKKKVYNVTQNIINGRYWQPQRNNYHFTNNPVLKKSEKSDEKVIIDDHIDSEEIDDIGDDLYQEVINGLECDMKD